MANFIRATAEEVKILTMLSGHDDIKDLSQEDLRAMDYDTAAITGLKLIGYDRRLPWWEMGEEIGEERKMDRLLWPSSRHDLAVPRSVRRVSSLRPVQSTRRVVVADSKKHK